MSDTVTKSKSGLPSATPSEEDIRAWEALTRDEQVERLRALLTQPDRTVAGTETMADILKEARARASAKRRG